MTQQESIKKYFDAMLQEGIISPGSMSLLSQRTLQYALKELFQGIEFKDKNLLDIGGGKGIHSFFAACMGAKEVICLEPGADGSRSDVVERFKRLHQILSLNQVELKPNTFQDFDPACKTFDIILLHNSINHLDETACINLLKDDLARKNYHSLFSKLSSLLKPGGKLIVRDCSRYNFFALLGIKNPVAPTIEWHKHQSPKTWATMLLENGFCNPKIRWLSLSELGGPGKFMGNKLMSYFLQSRFCLTMDKAS